MAAEPFWQEVFWWLPVGTNEQVRWWICHVGKEEPFVEVSLEAVQGLINPPCGEFCYWTEIHTKPKQMSEVWRGCLVHTEVVTCHIAGTVEIVPAGHVSNDNGGSVLGGFPGSTTNP